MIGLSCAECGRPVAWFGAGSMMSGWIHTNLDGGDWSHRAQPPAATLPPVDPELITYVGKGIPQSEVDRTKRNPPPPEPTIKLQPEYVRQGTPGLAFAVAMIAGGTATLVLLTIFGFFK